MHLSNLRSEGYTIFFMVAFKKSRHSVMNLRTDFWSFPCFVDQSLDLAELNWSKSFGFIYTPAVSNSSLNKSSEVDVWHKFQVWARVSRDFWAYEINHHEWNKWILWSFSILFKDVNTFEAGIFFTSPTNLCPVDIFYHLIAIRGIFILKHPVNINI